MEFLRFGSSIPGSYWGCCACCIIQNFKFHPSDKASIQIVNGDRATPITDKEGNFLFAGPTYEDIFWQRIRFGTFDKRDMPSHGFMAILTFDQLQGEKGQLWLAILKKAGFEFIRSISNSVYTGAKTGISATNPQAEHANYLFGLFRNIGERNIANPFLPPQEWADLSNGEVELCNNLSLTETQALADKQREEQLAVWESIPKTKLLTEKELEELKVPIIYSALRTEFPQQLKQDREALKQAKKPAKKVKKLSVAFPTKDAPNPCKEVLLNDESKGVLLQDG